MSSKRQASLSSNGTLEGMSRLFSMRNRAVALVTCEQTNYHFEWHKREFYALAPSGGLLIVEVERLLWMIYVKET
ncbi:unnamed protein product [Protopolystoma xenopodis]|uniref:Uncharacterized protein n=1 Tax=Protopolystoma xenopodis TaxID=117903 RepID=A0A3S5B9V3_9PLAT|nr:unnamed protein product [Protopolystoma xenopodis]